MNNSVNGDLAPCTCCGRHVRGNCPFCGNSFGQPAKIDARTGSVVSGRTGAVLIVAGTLAVSGCESLAILRPLPAYGGPPLTEEALKERNAKAQERSARPEEAAKALNTKPKNL